MFHNCFVVSPDNHTKKRKVTELLEPPYRYVVNLYTSPVHDESEVPETVYLYRKAYFSEMLQLFQLLLWKSFIQLIVFKSIIFPPSF